MSWAAAATRRGRFAAFVTLFTGLFVALEARFFYLQILHGSDFRERARSSIIARERIPPRRGLIRDREGKILADNSPSFRLSLTPHYIADPERKRGVLDALDEILGWTLDERAALEAEVGEALEGRGRWKPITLPGALVGQQCPVDGAALELMEEVDHRLVCPVDGGVHVPIDPKASYCPHDHKRIALVDGVARCRHCERVYVARARCPDHEGQALEPHEHNLQCPLCERTYSNQVAMVAARRHELFGVDLLTRMQRGYPFGYDAAHVLGYIHRVSAEDRERHPGVYELHDAIGRTGIESSLERTLRGESGEALYIKDSQGHRQRPRDLAVLGGERDFRPARDGHDVWLTLDMRLQHEVRQAFRYHRSGAAAVLDPRTGAVLALYSKPGFDPNDWARGLSAADWAEVQENPYAPLIHKAVTAYAPGSVYKIVTAVAALEEGIATPDLTIDCPGHYEFGGRRFHCHNKGGHGPMNLMGAIKHSCDVYFYRVGEMLGMDRLALWGERFGFGARTGVEVAERTGRVPTRAWHAEHTTLGWQPGFTLSTAIGQGSLTASTLQVARAYAALVNGGHLLRARLVEQITDRDRNVISRPRTEVIARTGASAESLSLTRQGLVAVVNDPDGTAPDSALDEIVMAGKTGTAEAAEGRPGASEALRAWLKEDHAWFAAYAPADDPQVVVAVFVEHGGSGSKIAAPIARRIVQSWLRLGFYRSSSEEGGLPEPEPGPAP